MHRYYAIVGTCVGYCLGFATAAAMASIYCRGL